MRGSTTRSDVEIGGDGGGSETAAGKCPDGFRYNQELNVCDDIDECSEDLDDCIQGKEICHNIVGNYLCQLTNDDQTSADNDQCPPGFR